MVKTKIIETTEKYDKDGKLVEKIMREETLEDNTDCTPSTNPNFSGTAVYTNPPYYTYCGTRCETHPSIGMGHISNA